MNFIKITALTVSLVLGLTGCSATKNLLSKRDNGSLNYQSSKKLDPILLPAEQEPVSFIPLYDTPAVKENTLNLSNESGKQYRLPKPPQAH